MTSIIDELVPKLRRTIEDTEEPYMYSDTALAEYIEDSMDSIQLKWKHDYEIDRDTHYVENDIPSGVQMLFVAQARYDLNNTMPDISYRTGTISVTRKTGWKSNLRREIQGMIAYMTMQEALGCSTDEFDNYERRFENLLY